MGEKGRFVVKNHSWQQKTNKINLLMSEFLMTSILPIASKFMYLLEDVVPIVGMPRKSGICSKIPVFLRIYGEHAFCENKTL